MKQRTILTPDMPLVSLIKHSQNDSPPPPLSDGGDSEASLVNPISDAYSSLNSASRPVESFVARQENSKVIQKLPLSLLRIHPFNSRSVRTQKRIEEVRDMLVREDEHNQREAITVVPGRKDDDRNNYYILSGQTRFHSAILAGWTEIDAQINYDIDPDDHLAFWSASIEHNTSIPETDYDLAIKAKQLSVEGVSNDQIRKALKRDDRALRRLFGMTELPEVVLAHVSDYPTVFSAALCDILATGLEPLGVAEVASLAKQVIEKDLSHSALRDLISAATRRKNAAAPTNRTRSTRVSHKQIMLGAFKAGDFKVMQAREKGKKLVTLTATLSESLVEGFEADIQTAIEKLIAQHANV